MSRLAHLMDDPLSWQGLYALALTTLLIVAPFPRTPTGQYLCIGAMALSVGMAAFQQRRFPVWGWGAIGPLAAWGVWIVLGMAGSVAPEYTWDEFRSEFLILGGLLLCTPWMLPGPQALRWTLRVLGASQLLLAGWQAWAFASGAECFVLPNVHYRYSSYLGHYDTCASLLCMLWPISLALALSEEGRWRWLAVASAVAGLGLQYLTFSRGGWAAYVFALALLGVFWRRWMLVGLVVGGLAGLPLVSGAIADRLASRNIGDRVQGWQAAGYMIADHPWLGVGYGNRNFGRLYPRYLPEDSKEGILQNAHNIPLQVAVETGIVGLIAFLSMVLGALREAWRALLLARDLPPEERRRREGLIWGPLAGALAFLLHGMGAYHLVNPGSLLFFACLGMFLALRRWAERDSATATPLP